MSIITDVIESTKAIIQGMGVTLSYIPKQKWTVQYPEEPVTVQPRYRGQHLLHVDENGKEKCVACFLCAAACPSECIYIVAKDDPRPAAERIGVDERYAATIIYVVDLGEAFIDARARFGWTRIVGSLDVDAFRRAGGSAQETRDTFLPAQLINVQQMLAAITRLHRDRLVRILDGLFAFGNIRQCHAHPLDDRARRIDHF